MSTETTLEGTSTERLFTCPLCTTYGFTLRGLRAHRCHANGRQPLSDELYAQAIRELRLICPRCNGTDFIESTLREHSCPATGDQLKGWEVNLAIDVAKKEIEGLQDLVPAHHELPPENETELAEKFKAIKPSGLDFHLNIQSTPPDGESTIQYFPASDPAAQRISTAYEIAQASAHHATLKAFHCGLMLSVQKEQLPHGQFQAWIENQCPMVHYRTAARWMSFSERVLKILAITEEFFSLTDGTEISLAEALDTPTEWLESNSARCLQTIRDFISDKRMSDVLSDCAIEGEDPSRVSRVANGIMLGGSHGEDRKDYPTFIQHGFKKIGAHFSHWDHFSTEQRIATERIVSNALAKMPNQALQLIAEQAKNELRNR